MTFDSPESNASTASSYILPTPQLSDHDIIHEPGIIQSPHIDSDFFSPSSLGSQPKQLPSFARTRSSSRAAPPPPIILHSNPSSAGSSTLTPKNPNHSAKSVTGPKGLNIRNLPNGHSDLFGSNEIDNENDTRNENEVEDLEQKEEKDGISEMSDNYLLSSPRRVWHSRINSINEDGHSNVGNGMIPLSPAWQSFEIPSPIPNASAAGVRGFKMPNSTSTSSLIPPSPIPIAFQHQRNSSVTANGSPTSRGGRRGSFDPTPTHGLHARNLSLFFPQPGVVQSKDGDKRGSVDAGGSVAGDGAGNGTGVGTGAPFGGDGQWTFAQAKAKPIPGVGDTEDQDGPLKRSRRRGHHVCYLINLHLSKDQGDFELISQHKHSLSHNFFSFLDPTVTNPNLAPPSPHPADPHSHLASPKPVDTPQPVPMPLISVALSLQSPTLSPLPRKSDPMSQLLASFAVLEFFIGANLWVEGQLGGWRCLAGAGYLIVFDAIGVGVGVVARGGEGWRSLRRPYGMTRFLSLLYFTQSLFLVFAAIYIAKESLEAVILGVGNHQHGGSSHGHAHVENDEDDRSFPLLLLGFATLASAGGGAIMHSHAKLVDAVGSLFLSPQYLSSAIVRRFPHLLANPFSLTITTSCLVLLIGGFLVEPHALHQFDALADFIMTTLTASLSIPTPTTFGRILLQTAPPATTPQMQQLQKFTKSLKNDPRVINILQTRCWAMTAGTSPPTPQSISSTLSTPSHSRNNSLTGEATPLNNLLHRGSITSITATSPSPPQPTAWHSPSLSPTVGEFGGIPPSQYPSLMNLRKEQDSPLVITMQVEVTDDLPEREILELTKMIWTSLSKVAGKGSNEVCVNVKRCASS